MSRIAKPTATEWLTDATILALTFGLSLAVTALHPDLWWMVLVIVPYGWACFLLGGINAIAWKGRKAKDGGP